MFSVDAQNSNMEVAWGEKLSCGEIWTCTDALFPVLIFNTLAVCILESRTGNV